MTTLDELVAAAPDPTFGIPQPTIVEGAGDWRYVLELADPGAGVDVEWFDVTDDHLGYYLVYGADAPFSRYRAAVIETELLAFGDQYSPRNPDTSARFGTHVPIGDGLLMRAGFIRVVGGEVVEWIPRWTGEVETWSHAFYGFVKKAGVTQRVRRHRIVLTDTMSTLPTQPVAEATLAENWPDRVDHVLGGWEFGYDVYGAETWDDSGPADVLELPTRDEQTDALAELATTCEPSGLIYHTDRTGRLIVRPHPVESFHAGFFALEGTTGTEYNPPATARFRYDAVVAGDGLSYADGLSDAGDSFGLESDRRGIVNHVRISDPSGPPPYDNDVPTSIQRHRRRTLSRSWIAANDTVANDILDRQAEAQRVAKPLRTTIHTRGFFPGVLRIGYLDPVEITHDDDFDGALITVAEGFARQLVERAGPSPALQMSIDVIVDVTAEDSTAALKPVEDLTATDVGPNTATIEWTHPTGQPATPTHFQIRNRNESDIPLEVGYGPTEFLWLFLYAETAYTFEVRLLRYVAGRVTHVSPWASHTFTTDELVTPVGGGEGPGGGTIIDAPDPDPGCVLEWQLQSSVDSVTWIDVDDGTWTEEPYEIDSSMLTPDILYRVRTREVCGGVPGDWSDWSDPFFIPADYGTPCITPPALSDAPYDDDSLVLYVPQLCAPATIRDAVSGNEATRGPSFATIGFDDDGNVILNAGSISGVVAYGQSLALRMSGNQARQVSASILHENDVEYLVAQAAGITIDTVIDGSDYVFRATAELVTGDLLVAESTTALVTGTEYQVHATYDPFTGTLRLYTGPFGSATELADAVASPTPMPLVDDRSFWYLGASSNGGWATDLAVWSEIVLVPAAADLPEFTDDFNRSDSTNLGSDWSERNGTGSATEWDISSNQLRQTANPGRQAYVTTPMSSPDQYVEVDVNDHNLDTLLILRAASASPNPLTWYYAGRVAAGQFVIYKFVSNTATQLATTAGSGIDGTRLRFEALGDQLKLYRDGVEILSTTDSSITTGGYVGIWAAGSGSLYDNFEAGIIA